MSKPAFVAQHNTNTLSVLRTEAIRRAALPVKILENLVDQTHQMYAYSRLALVSATSPASPVAIASQRGFFYNHVFRVSGREFKVTMPDAPIAHPEGGHHRLVTQQIHQSGNAPAGAVQLPDQALIKKL